MQYLPAAPFASSISLISLTWSLCKSYFTDENLFRVGQKYSPNSLKFVKEQNGGLVTRSVERVRGGATRYQCVTQGIIVTTIKDMDDGADNVVLLKMSKPFLQMNGVGYCVLISAYNLHPTMTLDEVASIFCN